MWQAIGYYGARVIAALFLIAVALFSIAAVWGVSSLGKDTREFMNPEERKRYDELYREMFGREEDENG